ncbi:type IV pilin N-terminal domain-containing protein [Methanoregula sp.]|uniref:type IV pilin N-terminal domain-containing protein n=1 Tax=Methanoregula sp. TaxID=2052170 RepID=UPI00262041B6|nr:type IV pilin N-terminal domain-containing protein [Methanoregula sp.]MDD5144347.1 type IV pilin N-terminal domain-containing protein [Methanoregula sp.]
MKQIFRYDNGRAVSPVVGVMLMLVVTIIIAAVVSAFAGGLSGDTKKAPQSVIDADIKYQMTNSMKMVITNVNFRLLSGDPLITKDLSIITYYTNSSGITLKHEQTATSPVTDLNAGTPYSATTYNSRVPCNFNLENGRPTDPRQHFGNYTWLVGDTITSYDDAGTAALLGMSGTWDGSLLDPDLKPGSIVDIKILHKPSNKILFDKEVVVT